jgi:hypothetical protein
LLHVDALAGSTAGRMKHGKQHHAVQFIWQLCGVFTYTNRTYAAVLMIFLCALSPSTRPKSLTSVLTAHLPVSLVKMLY